VGIAVLAAAGSHLREQAQGVWELPACLFPFPSPLSIARGWQRPGIPARAPLQPGASAAGREPAGTMRGTEDIQASTAVKPTRRGRCSGCARLGLGVDVLFSVVSRKCSCVLAGKSLPTWHGRGSRCSLQSWLGSIGSRSRRPGLQPGAAAQSLPCEGCVTGWHTALFNGYSAFSVAASVITMTSEC